VTRLAKNLSTNLCKLVYIYKVTFSGGDMTVGSSPTDRSKLGTKRHILTDKQGIPLSAIISSASTHDMKAVTKMLLIIQLSK
jgi:hypothetical protein